MAKHRIPSFEIEPGERLTLRCEEDDKGRVVWYVRLEDGGVYRIDRTVTAEALELSAIPMEDALMDSMRLKLATAPQ